MQNLDTQSALKAGGAAAGVAVLMMLLSLIPILGDIIGICFICGGFLIPIAAGMVYGYFAPGEEDTGTSAVGGAVSGGIGGILLGIFFALSATVTGSLSEGIGSGLLAGAVSSVLCSVGLGVMGIVLGAIGGLIWPMVQEQFAGRN